MVAGNNNRTPVEVVRLFVDTTTTLFEQNKEAIEYNTSEIKDLRECLTKTVNILNQNPSNAEIDVKLTESISRTNTMITSVKVAVGLIAICGILAVFGSQMLFKMELSKQVVVVTPTKEKVTQPDTLKKLDWIIEKMEELEEEIKECQNKEEDETE